MKLENSLLRILAKNCTKLTSVKRKVKFVFQKINYSRRSNSRALLCYIDFLLGCLTWLMTGSCKNVHIEISVTNKINFIFYLH